MRGSALGLERLAQAPGRGVDDEGRQAARGVVSFLFCFTFFGPISPHELLFFRADNKGEGEGGSAWWQGGDAVDVTGAASTEGAPWPWLSLVPWPWLSLVSSATAS